jgi:hypothetical protein
MGHAPLVFRFLGELDCAAEEGVNVDYISNHQYYRTTKL